MGEAVGAERSAVHPLQRRDRERIPGRQCPLANGDGREQGLRRCAVDDLQTGARHRCPGHERRTRHTDPIHQEVRPGADQERPGPAGQGRGGEATLSHGRAGPAAHLLSRGVQWRADQWSREDRGAADDAGVGTSPGGRADHGQFRGSDHLQADRPRVLFAHAGRCDHAGAGSVQDA